MLLQSKIKKFNILVLGFAFYGYKFSGGLVLCLEMLSAASI